MPLVTPTSMLQKARQGQYAIGAFNTENMEMAQAIISAAEELNAPVMIQTTSGTLGYAPPECFAGMVKGLAQEAKVPIALHLDHGSSFVLAQRCARAGYTSLMIDGSLLPFADNIALTRRVVDMAGDLPVEAELGTVGGKEDDHEAGVQYTDPSEAKTFVEQTGISSFAVAIGTAHGVYKGAPKIDLRRLEEIRALVEVPLVLHGTSGVPDEMVRACIQRGICKVNYATDLRIAFTNGVKAYLAKAAEGYDPKKYLAAGREAVREHVQDLIRLCGSDGKA